MVFDVSESGVNVQERVFLDRSGGCSSVEYSCYSADESKGYGNTPELAYTDLLKKTADRLAVLYGFAPDVEPE